MSEDDINCDTCGSTTRLKDCLRIGKYRYNICPTCYNAQRNKESQEIAQYFHTSHTDETVAETAKLYKEDIGRRIKNYIVPPEHVKTEYVYFIGEGKDKPVKIGISVSPRNRLKALQTAYPVQLNILGVLSGGTIEESALHSKYSYCRLSGEWFEWNAEIEKEINRANKRIDW